MSLNKIIVIGVLAVFFIGCKRNGSVSGKVTSVFDNSPIEGMVVRVRQDAELDPSAKALQVGTTDANGLYKMNVTYNTRVTYDYYISLNPNENYNNTDPFSVKDTSSAISKTYLYYDNQYKTISEDIKPLEKSKGNQATDFSVAPCGRLRVIARNVAPAAEEDKIDISLVDINLPNGFKTIYTGTGVTPPPANYMLAPTNGSVSLKWKVTTNSQEQTFYDTILLPPYSKANYYINY